MHTNVQVGVRPNIRAVDKGVVGKNGPCLQDELGLDRGTATHELVSNRQNELVHLRKLTTSLLPSSGGPTARMKAQRGRQWTGTERRMYQPRREEQREQK